MVLLGGAIATQAVKEYYRGKGVLLPVGLLGIAYATIFGHIGLWVCNAITSKEERNKQVVLILALVVFPLIAISAFMFVQNKNYDISAAAVKPQISPSNVVPEPRGTVTSPVIPEAGITTSDLMLEDAEEYTYSNGLIVKRPFKFTKSLANNGFVFTETGNIRSPRFIALSISNTEPTSGLEKRRTLSNGTTVAYPVHELGSGSGGIEYELSSARKIGDRWITLSAIEQTFAKLLSINVGTLREFEYKGRTAISAIWKLPVAGRVAEKGVNVEGDDQADRKAHGGVDKAIYAYAIEDLTWWKQQIEQDIGHGQFGENLTTQGIDVNNALVGEHWQIGSTILEVSEPRIPCWRFGVRMNDKTFPKIFTQALRPGAYLRIIQEGDIGSGDEIKIIKKPKHDLTIKDVFRNFMKDRDEAERILESESMG